MTYSQYSDMYLPGMYSSNCNSIPFMASSDYNALPFMAQQVQAQDEEGDSLGAALTGGLLFMAPIQGRHVIAHPLRSWEALSKTNEEFAKLRRTKAFQNLSNFEQGEAYNKLFRQNQLGYKVGIKGYRNAAETKQLTKALELAKKDYLTALRSGNNVRIAKTGAKMTTLLEQGQRGAILGGLRQRELFGLKVANANTVIKAADKAGAEAATIAATAKTAAKTASSVSKGAQAAAWGKSAFKTGGGVAMAAIEGVMEVPEIYTAFSEGGVGEGIVQTAKSTAKVGASVAGWCAGAKAGAAGGAAIGTAICPGVGTAIGTAIGGIVGGISGSWLGTKIAGFFTGKSYSEKKKEIAIQPKTPVQVASQPSVQPSFSRRTPVQNINFGSLNPYLPTYQETAACFGAYV